MLLPPTSGLLASMTDPLRKRPSTFSRTNKDVDTDSTVWTETPQEKMQRLEDEKAGIKRKKGGKTEDDSEESARKRLRDEEIRRGVEKHNVGCCVVGTCAGKSERLLMGRKIRVGRHYWSSTQRGTRRGRSRKRSGIMRGIWASRAGCFQSRNEVKKSGKSLHLASISSFPSCLFPSLALVCGQC